MEALQCTVEEVGGRGPDAPGQSLQPSGTGGFAHFGEALLLFDSPQQKVLKGDASFLLPSMQGEEGGGSIYSGPRSKGVPERAIAAIERPTQGGPTGTYSFR